MVHKVSSQLLGVVDESEILLCVLFDDQRGLHFLQFECAEIK